RVRWSARPGGREPPGGGSRRADRTGDPSRLRYGAITSLISLPFFALWREILFPFLANAQRRKETRSLVCETGSTGAARGRKSPRRSNRQSQRFALRRDNVTDLLGVLCDLA